MSLVSMSGNEDWLMRPVLRGLCRMESIYNGALDLIAFSLMNEAIDVCDENEDLVRPSGG